MGKLPRKILEEKIWGFVYIQKLGLIPVEDKEEKEEVMALGEICLEGFDKGYLFRENEEELPKFKGEAPKRYKESLQVLFGHGMENNYLLEKYYFLRKEAERLSKLKLRMVFLKKETIFNRY